MKQQVIENKKRTIKEMETRMDLLYREFKRTDDRSLIFKIQDIINYLEHLYIELRILEEK